MAKGKEREQEGKEQDGRGGEGEAEERRTEGCELWFLFCKTKAS